MRVPGSWGELDIFYYSIKLNMADNDALLKLYKPTGNEYKEYLENKQ